MRITYVYGAYPPIPDGGAGFVQNLATTLAQRGHDVSVVTTEQISEVYADNFCPQGVNVLPIISDWEIRRSSYGVLKNALQETCPQVVHAIYPSATFGRTYQLPTLIKLASRTPLVTTLYGFGVRQGVKNQAAILTLLHSSNILASDNDRVMTLIRKYLPHLSGRIRYLPSGSNIIRYAPNNTTRHELRTGLGMIPDRFYVCYFGYLNADRGLDPLFRAIKICKDDGADVGLVMIGTGPQTCPNRGDAEYFEYLARLAKDLGIEENVLWTEFGTEDQVAQYFRACDAGTLPYRQNTLGHSSLPAALSFGLPVITTAANGQKELPPLKDHTNSLLIPPDDPESLALAISEIRENSALKRELGSAAFALWKEVFSWEAIADRVTALYGEVL